MAELSAGRGYDARLSACPACDAAPLAGRIAAAALHGDLILSIPTAHCAACITDVERALMAQDGVRAARVNLTLRRVMIDAPGHEAAEFIPVLEKIGYEAHELDGAALSSSAADRQGRDILMRIGIAGFAMMNIMILSVAVWSGATGATRDMFHWISAVIALPTVIFAGQPFFVSAWSSLKGGRLGMDVPISLALILATAISLFETLNSGRHAYFDAAVMLCFFLLVGRYLDYRTRAVARSAAEELTALEVPRASLVADGGERIVNVADLVPGDVIRVRPGARLPADGQVIAGMSEIDRSLLTGESLPVQAGPGDALSAGEINLTGPLDLRVTAAGRDSSLSRLADLVAMAEAARGRYASLAERASRAYAPVVHLLALLSFGVWMLQTGDWRVSLNIAAAVLIITCPCALGLAVPAVVTAASGRLFRRGLLIKDGTALERMAEVDIVVFDKTGTLTLGRPELVGASALPPALRPVALAVAAASGHPLSRALAAALEAEGVTPATLEQVAEMPGYGVTARWQGRELRLGRADWAGAETPQDAEGPVTVLSVAGETPVLLRFADTPRPGAAETVAALKAQGRQVVMLSGDTDAAVAHAAAQFGISRFRAGVTPAEKEAEIAALHADGAHVLMVGDGLNDTAALSRAHVSVSPATALDAARVASDIVLMGQDLTPVAEALDLAQRARRRIKENFAISVAYNIVAVPFAMAGLATPLMAALAMSASSVSVTLNALRLR
ncbi:heavy metal translocating P-type ATPase [Paracoccus aerodenitrificans]|uniref:heavy metal translocating P-type ATPase n=1 Tax=Paracoccus aerodenitrificans TaxID=3017781 RepID=UPI0022F11F8B|nr:heavy metal translocating P-type ATPase [Paracoccus aerodenitrificans]WBU65195.1 heavy metal translocating P-type ATPase [Paracoccus aerodenitrificans]